MQILEHLFAILAQMIIIFLPGIFTLFTINLIVNARQSWRWIRYTTVTSGTRFPSFFSGVAKLNRQHGEQPKIVLHEPKRTKRDPGEDVEHLAYHRHDAHYPHLCHTERSLQRSGGGREEGR